MCKNFRRPDACACAVRDGAQAEGACGRWQALPTAPQRAEAVSPTDPAFGGPAQVWLGSGGEEGARALCKCDLGPTHFE